MSLIVESGQGLSNADSYLSIADADAYHAAHGAPATWTDSTDPQKEFALRIATQYLDMNYGQRWDGTRIKSTMSLDWPRYGVVDRDGFEVVPTAVPQQVEDATAYLALKVREGDVLIPDVAASTSANTTAQSVTVGPISISESYSDSDSFSSSPYYPTVVYMLGELISAAGRVYRS